MLDVLEHLPDPLPPLRRALALVGDRGVLVATVPAFRSLWTSHDDINEHFERYTKQPVRRAPANGPAGGWSCYNTSSTGPSPRSSWCGSSSRSELPRHERLRLFRVSRRSRSTVRSIC